MRALLLLATLLAPLAAGCLGDEEAGPRLAQPTDAPPQVPRRPSTVADPARPNLTDEGFLLTEPWRAGDAWDWESATHWRSLRVVESQVLQGRPHLRLVHANGTLGPGPVTKVAWWVDLRDYAKVNQTALEGGRNATFSPPAPGLRAFRNASLQYVEVGAPQNATVRANVWYKGTERTQSVWGEVVTGHVESWTVRSGHEPARVHLVRHVSREWGHDAAFEENGERYRLVAYRFGSAERGVLRAV